MIASERNSPHDHKEGYHGYSFTDENFEQIRIATIVCTVVSLVFSVITTFTYIYIRLSRWKHSSRVSLRCVVLSSVAYIVASIVHMIIVHKGEASPACFAARPLVMLFRILSVSALVLIGINLFLVFVIRIKKTEHLEYYYYPVAVFYSMCSVAYPFYLSYHPCRVVTYDRSCWYHTYFEKDDCAEAAWLSYYCWMFFMVLIAFGCSGAALVKMTVSRRNISKQMAESDANRMTGCRMRTQQLSGGVGKVVIRCIMYPIVPFICNIWGFIANVLVVRRDARLSFPLAMVDGVFQSLEGLFVACIFFTDPVITVLIKDKMDHLYLRYVKDYGIIHVPFDDDDLANGRCSKKVHVRHIAIPPYMRRQQGVQSVKDLVILRSYSAYHSNKKYQDAVIAIDKNCAYIPYCHPFLAAILHWILSRLKHSTPLRPESPKHFPDSPSSELAIDCGSDKEDSRYGETPYRHVARCTDTRAFSLSVPLMSPDSPSSDSTSRQSPSIPRSPLSCSDSPTSDSTLVLHPSML